MNGRLRVNLGCGTTRPEGWINTDCSLNSLAQKWPVTRKVARYLIKSEIYEDSNVQYMNINRSWPWRDGSVDVVYGSHVFEHLTLRSGDHFLKESQRVLGSGGVLRLVIPDLYQLAKQYVSAFESRNPDAASHFLYALNLHLENTIDEKRTKLFRLVHSIQGHPHQHKYMYDAVSIRQALENAKFKDIRECSYGVSKYVPEIRDVESTKEGISSIYLEAIKA